MTNRKASKWDRNRAGRAGLRVATHWGTDWARTHQSRRRLIVSHLDVDVVSGVNEAENSDKEAVRGRKGEGGGRSRGTRHVAFYLASRCRLDTG